MTAGNSTVTLHNESWDRIQELLKRETGQTGNPTPVTISNTIDAQRSTVRRAIAVCGLPGAGKSKVAKTVRDVAASVGTDRVALVDSPGKLYDREVEFFVVDHVSTVAEYDALCDATVDCKLVHVQADLYTRLARLNQRDDEDLDSVALSYRDLDYESNGLSQLLYESDDWAADHLPELDGVEYDYGYVDHEFPNDGGPETLRYNVGVLLSQTAAWPTPPLPDEPKT